jgi:4-hydroxybenzoate polyprenyltransferase
MKTLPACLGIKNALRILLGCTFLAYLYFCVLIVLNLIKIDFLILLLLTIPVCHLARTALHCPVAEIPRQKTLFLTMMYQGAIAQCVTGVLAAI